MRRGQIITIAIAGVAGLGAAVVAKNAVTTSAPKVEVRTQTINTVQVLVAQGDIGLGATITRGQLRWQHWPMDAIPQGAITNNSRANAVTELSGYVARAPLIANEPISMTKLVKPESGGVLAAILQPGMRAISTRIKEETGVGRLILPNDHVDVILTQRKRGRQGAEEFVSDVLFRNVRILAIGQMVEVKSDKPSNQGQPGGVPGGQPQGGQQSSRLSVDGNTATLELTPKQAELLALANSMGEIALALRSVADINTTGDGGAQLKRDQPSGIRIMRYGTKTRANGVQ